MAKKKAGRREHGTTGESIGGYFRKLFAENPRWLDSRSNDELFVRWLKDHPGETEVPERVRQNLSNIKSVLRRQGRKQDDRREQGRQPIEGSAAMHRGQSVRGLDSLEEQIDDCLSLAKVMDREGLASVIALLRRARNEVVWSMGKSAEA
jgi:hypothetical protein